MSLLTPRQFFSQALLPGPPDLQVTEALNDHSLRALEDLSLPDGANIRSANAAIAADYRHVKIHAGRRYDPVEQVGNIPARHLPHSLDDLPIKGSFLDYVFMVSKSILQLFIRRNWQAIFLGQVDDLRQTNRRKNNSVSCRCGLINEPERRS
jgi:hypothetical protein